MKINRVRRMADLPADLAENVRHWPHYQATSDTDPDDAYTVTYPATKCMPERTETYDPLTSEDGERGERRLTGYAYAGTTSDGYRLFIFRFNASTFTYGYMPPGSEFLTVGARDQHMTKAAAEEWVAEQLALDLDPAREAGTVAYNIGRPNTWDEHVPGGWGERRITDPRMERIVSGVWGLARTRLGRAFSEAWEDNANHDRDSAPRCQAQTCRVALEPRDRVTPEQAWCGDWYDHPPTPGSSLVGHTASVLVPSPELAAERASA